MHFWHKALRAPWAGYCTHAINPSFIHALPQSHQNQLSLFYTTAKWLMNLPCLGLFLVKDYFLLLLHSPHQLQKVLLPQPSCCDILRCQVTTAVAQPSLQQARPIPNSLCPGIPQLQGSSGCARGSELPPRRHSAAHIQIYI